MNLNQKGFGVVESLLVVIAITLIVGVGFYVVNANKDEKKPDDTSQSTSSTQEKPAEQAKKDYLEIKEFGVKVPVGDELKGVTYVVPQKGEVDLVSEELVPLVNACFPGEEMQDDNKGVFMSVGKTNGQYTQKQGTDETFLKQFDTFYLSAGLGSIACAVSENANAEKQYSTKSEQLYKAGIEAFKNAEKL
jgi:hypothetical protein